MSTETLLLGLPTLPSSGGQNQSGLSHMKMPPL